MKLEELEKLIDVENLAKEDAKKNLPVTDSEGPDSSESKIRLIIKGLLIDKINIKLIKIYFIFIKNR